MTNSGNEIYNIFVLAVDLFSIVEGTTSTPDGLLLYYNFTGSGGRKRPKKKKIPSYFFFPKD